MILQLFMLLFLVELNNGNKIIQPLRARQILANHLDGRNPLVVKKGINRLSVCSNAAVENKPRPRFFTYDNETQECTLIMGRNNWFLFWHGPGNGKAATAYIDWRHWKPGKNLVSMLLGRPSERCYFGWSANKPATSLCQSYF